MGKEAYYDLSTLHVHPEDIDRLRESTASPVCYAYPEGVFVHIAWGGPQDVAEGHRALARDGFSPALQACIREARAQGCAFLRLDADGPVEGHLPIFEEKW